MMDLMVKAILDGRKTVTRRIGPTWAGVQPGTRLWVREAHALLHACCWPDLPHRKHDEWADMHTGPQVLTTWAFYRTGFDRTPPRWRPSIHMPRWACRLELEVVSVTEQHGLCVAWDVDTDEAHREGFQWASDFHEVWHSMHPDYDGPVYRVEFRRVQP
jgi:hypothetical protein